MKKMFFLMLTLLITSTASVNAQVTIGADANPHSGAILDLQSNTQGLKLPNVSIDDLDVFGLPLSGSSTEANAKGIMVYNINPSTGEGIYVWNGGKWLQLGLPGTPVTPVQWQFTVSTTGGGTVQGTPSGMYDDGTVISVSAVPAGPVPLEGVYQFDGWYDLGGSGPSFVTKDDHYPPFTLNADVSLEVRFSFEQFSFLTDDGQHTITRSLDAGPYDAKPTCGPGKTALSLDELKQIASPYGWHDAYGNTEAWEDPLSGTSKSFSSYTGQFWNDGNDYGNLPIICFE